MTTTTINKPGSLVSFRGRDWMVLPSDDPELLLIKPLGGAEEETTAVYLPLQLPEERVTLSKFPEPAPEDLGSFETAKLLFDASRLSFRNASGPFRCMGKLSFRPRSYQIVPLVMTLRQEVVRLMVADDVGIGKTIEALIILKELIERGEIKKFAVICPPHLCEQWQSELKDKLDIEAEIIRSSTAASLDRKLPDDRSVFYHVPYQVISIDYIKADKRRGIFLIDCPEFVIVDEAHTCALPEGSKSKSQQQRHALLHEIAEDTKRHLLLLTATPHSGKDQEFTSLLGLLNPAFRNLNFEEIEQSERRKIAKHFIQRKRENIKRWLNQVTPFPERDAKEIGYGLSPNYRSFYLNVLQFAKSISSSRKEENEQVKLIRSWAAIALLRGVMSSPEMAKEMLKKRQEKTFDLGDTSAIPDNKGTLFEDLEVADDTTRTDLLERLQAEVAESKELQKLYEQAENLCVLEHDFKIQATLNIIKKWLREGFQPIIFCKYIATANYVAEILKKHLPNKVDVQAVTSELADEQRKEKIELMGQSEQRVLVATDCLSEGINLQAYFTAMLHYDLPWNPNRIEQREGRVDRFGQDAEVIKTYVLYGEDNPMDTFVLEVLIRKVREIQKAIGVAISIGEDSKSIMAEAANKILYQEDGGGSQIKLFAEETVSNELEQARKKGENLRSIFAHESIKPHEIEADLEEIDESIGDVTTVENFVINAVTNLGASFKRDEKGYVINPQNLPHHLKAHFGDKGSSLISFESPTPKGYRYIGRNHTFVEQLCQFLLSLAFEGHPDFHQIARASVIQTDKVTVKTTLIMFRVRNVIKEVLTKKEVVAEEMYLWGYQGSGNQAKTLEYKEAKELLQQARSTADFSREKQEGDISRELDHFERLQPKFIDLATTRAEHLVEAHSRFKNLVGGRRFEKATPVLPPDVMGIYILMPKPKALS